MLKAGLEKTIATLLTKEDLQQKISIDAQLSLSDLNKKTDEMVVFTGAIDFKVDNLERGKLLIEKASAVDIPGKNGPLVIPIRFK